VPPQLEDLPGRGHEEHVLRAVGRDVAGQPADRQRRSAGADPDQVTGVPVLADRLAQLDDLATRQVEGVLAVAVVRKPGPRQTPEPGTVRGIRPEEPGRS
jgi:hypothetical protein